RVLSRAVWTSRTRTRRMMRTPPSMTSLMTRGEMANWPADPGTHIYVHTHTHTHTHRVNGHRALTHKRTLSHTHTHTHALAHEHTHTHTHIGLSGSQYSLYNWPTSKPLSLSLSLISKARRI